MTEPTEPGLQPGDVIIISGPPGAGKTTVADLLARRFEAAVHLESDWFFRWIKQGFIPPHLPESDVQNRAVMATVTAAAAHYATAGYVVVWDGVVGPWMLDRIRPELGRAGCRVHYLILLPERSEAVARVIIRDGSSDSSGVEVMHDKFASIEGFDRHTIDATGSVGGVLGRCSALLDTGEARL